MNKIVKFLLAFIAGLGAFLSLLIAIVIFCTVFAGPGYLMACRNGSLWWITPYAIEGGIMGMYMVGYLPLKPDHPAEEDGDEYEEIP